MEAKRINQEEITVLDMEPGIINAERSLILLDNRPQKKIDETISTPHQYVSRYHYETKNLGSFLELCPHCRKPSITSLRKTVVDTAIKYLNQKEDRGRRYCLLFVLSSDVRFQTVTCRQTPSYSAYFSILLSF
jgi:hypothetical protein